MGDLDGAAVTGGEHSVPLGENIVGKGLAEDGQMPPGKSSEVDVVYDTISSLKVNAINWQIQGRCTRKSKITPYESTKGKVGKMMSFDFEDGSGIKIKGVAFNDTIKSLDQEICVGKNYAISKATVQKGYGRPILGYHNCELLFYKHSKLELLKDGDDYVVPVERFRRLCELDSGDVDIDSSINLLAVVSSVGSMQNMEIKNSDGTLRNAACLEVQLVDSSLKQGEIPMTFWGPAAVDVRRHPAGCAIELKGAVVVSREGRLGLKATRLTDFEFDPKSDAAQDLIRWFDGGKKRRVQD